MNRFLRISPLLLSIVIGTATPLSAQWYCQYATWDSDTNGTGNRTASVAVMSENNFFALVMRPGTSNFIVPYKNADSSHGRLYKYGYGSPATNVFQVWTDGLFDQVQMFNMYKITATKDSMIYGANNDPDHNILVFKLTRDTILIAPGNKRQPTGTNSIFGIEVDQAGYVYVCNDTTTGKTDDIKIYPPISSWTDLHNQTPSRTVDLPDGIYKGITVSADGKIIFVSDYTNRRILKYKGSVASGFTQDAGFIFTMSPTDSVAGGSLKPSVLGLAYLSPNNILFATTQVWLGGGTYYSYGKILLINPKTGALVSTDSTISVINTAQWNFTITGGYNLRGSGTAYGNASGYTSNYDVEFDDKGNLYTQSYYGWTADKWKYNGTLPTITLTDVKLVEGVVPHSFDLGQNYPNPFNPSTTFDFTVPTAGHVVLRVYDVLGRHVETAMDEVVQGGVYHVRYDASHLSGGTYFYTITFNGRSQTKRMILLK